MLNRNRISRSFFLLILVVTFIFLLIISLVENDDDLLDFFSYNANVDDQKTGENGWFTCQIKGCFENWTSSSTKCCQISYCETHKELNDRQTFCTLEGTDISSIVISSQACRPSRERKYRTRWHLVASGRTRKIL